MLNSQIISLECIDKLSGYFSTKVGRLNWSGPESDSNPNPEAYLITNAADIKDRFFYHN